MTESASRGPSLLQGRIMIGKGAGTPSMCFHERSMHPPCRSAQLSWCSEYGCFCRPGQAPIFQGPFPGPAGSLPSSREKTLGELPSDLQLTSRHPVPVTHQHPQTYRIQLAAPPGVNLRAPPSTRSRHPVPVLSPHPDRRHRMPPCTQGWVGLDGVGGCRCSHPQSVRASRACAAM